MSTPPQILSAALWVALAAKPVLAAPGSAPATAHVLLLGDSTLHTSYLPAGQRAADSLASALRAAFPGQSLGVLDHAQDGDFVGNLLASGRYRRQVLAKLDDVDVVVVRFGGNDWKRMSPALFEAWLAALVDTLRADYPGVIVVLETGMYFDPSHGQAPGAPGGDQNTKADQYWARTRAVAEAKHALLSDVNAALRAATADGRWDLRIRHDGTLDASADSAHLGDPTWFENSHPNRAGVAVAVETTVGVLRRTFAAGLPTSAGHRAGDGHASLGPATLPGPHRTNLCATAGPFEHEVECPAGSAGAATFELRTELASPTTAQAFAEVRTSAPRARIVALGPAQLDADHPRAGLHLWFNAVIAAGESVRVLPKPGVSLRNLVIDRITFADAGDAR